MAKFTITVDLDWLDNEESIDDAIRDEVVNGAREYLLNKTNMEIQKKLDAEIGKKLVQAQEIVDKTIDQYIQVITTDNISKLKIAEKESTWSDKVVMIPITEYIGKKFDEFCNKKRYNSEFKVADYDRDKQYSMAEKSIQEYLKNVLEKQVSYIVKNAQENAELEIVKSLEDTLKANLAEETIKKMNIPQVLKNLEAAYVGRIEEK